MQLTDRMIKETQELNKQKRKAAEIRFDQEDEDVETLTYMPTPSFKYLNEDRGIFDNTDETSINTAKSVFDKTAVFRVSR